MIIWSLSVVNGCCNDSSNSEIEHVENSCSVLADVTLRIIHQG